MNWDWIEPVIMIIGIDIVLGGDNAVVIALASRNLPKHQRNKAILLGTGLAILARIALTMIALYMLKIPFLQLIGGVFLLYIAIRLLTGTDEGDQIEGSNHLWSAVKTIVVADIVMGFDNVLAIAGASHNNIYLVILGLFISVPIIVWGSRFILKLMDKFPLFIYFGAGLLAYTAAEMIKEDAFIFHLLHDSYGLNQWLSIILVASVLLPSFLYNKKTKKA